MKRVFRKQSLVVDSIGNDAAETVGLVGVSRQQVNAPVSMLGLALSVGATASVVSIPGLALAAEGSSIVVLPDASTWVQEPVAAPTNYYTVNEGDTLWHIAARHQADVDTITTVNGISQDDVLREGQVLRLPTETLTAEGETLGALGGEDLAMAEAPTSVALLSAEDGDSGWVTLETGSDLEALESETDALTEDPASNLNGANASAAPAIASAAPSSSWQDASVSLAAAPTREISPKADLADPSAPGAALPMSMALHGEPSQPVVSTPSAPPVAVVVPQTPAISEPSREAAALPGTLPAADPETVVDSEPVITTATNSTRSRDQVIQDHLARIRESNGALVDREVLNERIRQARLELERTRTEAMAPGATGRSATVAEVNVSVARSSALLARESTFDTESTSPEAVRSQSSGPVLPNLPTRGIEAPAALAPQAGWTVTDAATEATAASPEVAVAPQLQLPSLPDATPTSPADRPASNQLLAAAPMGPEAYRPFAAPEAGQTVSPAMPLLPGSDSFLPEAPNRFAGYVWPTHGTFTSGYGWRWGRMHRGIDVAGPVGTPVVAAATGVVVRSGWNSGGYGNMVDIRHPDGSLTRYAHNSRLLVREGQQVAQGQQIAEMGSTGRSTGPHLHFEIHLPGSGTVNPMAYLPSR
ncbi:MAG: peptidoglycan DD-metalloendopeptidase family protein [Leptolyngbya sp.]|nr:peptidoglycan DD-metalloendopeptidase family protein [Leptolyngbya sp.]